ncbi:hypothetical protein VNPA142037_27930 [Pseudomonas aeruginosa]|nr:hypothetical protein VNPA120840_41950 [Pseudomonas aeruginosa]GLF04433.1 hypothetical protein VNPA120889_45890 [Pseudomonas aeruginosa]GLF36723.1 hypothetical protein VNPA141581_54890 [Pseudomonas aeruginosa]GLF65001.1 hypothetical protein VNPA142037_27930 [Pseudomonas aeruginosa]
MGMAPPLLVVTPTKGHVGWDVPVSVARRAGLPHSGRRLAAPLRRSARTEITGNGY